MAALGDHVAEHFVGAAAEAHQRGHPIEPFEEVPDPKPVGAEQLTTYKYVVRGTGQTRP